MAGKKSEDLDYLPTKEEVRVNQIKSNIIAGAICWIFVALAIFFVQGLFVIGFVIIGLAIGEAFLLFQKSYPKYEEIILKIFNFPATLIMLVI